MSKEEKANPYKEMEFPKKEVEETLPFDPLKNDDKPQTDYLDEIQNQKNRSSTPNYSQPLMFNDEGKENLIKDLLRVDWERIEHIIRGHKPKIDNDGNEYFIPIENHYLNEKGINSILHYLSFYLSKDIRLARYSSEQVELIMKQFSEQFTDWFYDNVEEFGLDTPEKKKMSKMFVHSVIALVDASYSCAIEGKTIELMLKQFNVSQQEPLSENQFNPNSISKNKPSMMQRIFG